MALQFLLLPFFLWFLYSIMTFRLSKRYKDEELQRLYKIGLLLKFFGGFAFFVIYKYYYLYGDTFVYYRGGNYIAKLFYTDFAGFTEFLFSPASNFSGIDSDKYGYIIFYLGKAFKDADSFLMVKLCAICNIITGNSYLFSTFIFSTLSFYGLWKMFVVFDRRYKHLRKYLFIAIFGIPSVLFWGSGILKDTATIGCLGLAFFHIDKIFFRGKIRITSILMLVICSLMILTLKAYVLLAFIPALLLGTYFFYITNIKGAFARYFLALVLLVGFIFGGAFLLQYFATMSQDFALDRLAEVAESFQSSHGRLSESGQAGSGYSLRITNYTMSGMIAVLPQAVNVSLFRPYLWEANSPVMLVSALESFVIAGFTLKVIWKKGIFKFLRLMLEPFALMGIVYSIILGFAIGITAFNFGALVRFKIPLISFFLISLFIIQNKDNKSVEKAELDSAPDSPDLVT